MSRWYPLGVTHEYVQRPQAGRLVALNHEVWRVVEHHEIHEANWTDDERDARDRDQFGYFKPPYHLIADDRNGKRAHMRVPANWGGSWNLYPESGRWPQCSCCGEPMPCRAEMEDREVAESLKRMEEHAAKLAGACWACGEQITPRQDAVTYAGINLDSPGGPEVRFHTRRRCYGSALRYEDRWRKDDSARPRILTWPACKGELIIHGDGTSECHNGEDDCQGHETHDHGHLMACYVQSLGCGRGCPQAGHPGARPNARPRRSQQALSEEAA